MEIKTRNTNTLCPELYQLIREHGVSGPSRNGPVLRLPEPITITIHRPWERVNFSPERDANPFFHFMESMAMLGNVNSAPLLSFFAKNMANYSDNGDTFNAFYGSRARGGSWANGGFETDQLEAVIEILRRDPASRQAVVDLWRVDDLVSATKDKACNMMMVFSVVHDAVVLTTFNRSNDAIWGHGSGANVVHFPYFQEYVATSLGRRMGPWHHVSNNMHVYTDNPQWATVRDATVWPDYYTTEPLEEEIFALWDFTDSRAHWLAELKAYLLVAQKRAGVLPKDFFVSPIFMLPFFRHTALPILNSWCAWKEGFKQHAVHLASGIEQRDWRIACTAWLNRRISKSHDNTTATS